MRRATSNSAVMLRRITSLETGNCTRQGRATDISVGNPVEKTYELSSGVRRWVNGLKEYHSGPAELTRLG